MAIVFTCASCNARFEVDPRLAGRKGRCKKCGEPMVIPGPAEANAPRLSPARAGASVRRDPAPSIPAQPVNWIEAVNSQVALKAITVGGLRPIAKPSALDDADFSGPYQLAHASLPAARAVGPRSGPAGRLTMAYRGQLSGIARFFRWVNESAYLISVPFLIVLLMGGILQNRSLALLGAAVVVALNITRLVSGLINLVAIPFRDGPLQGLFFVIPPLTFLYLMQNWKRMRKPVGRVVEPVLTLGVVVLAFTFLPGLVKGSGSGKGKPAAGSFTERIESGARDLGKDLRGKLPDVDTSGLQTKARQAIGSLKDAVKPADAAPAK